MVQGVITTVDRSEPRGATVHSQDLRLARRRAGDVSLDKTARQGVTPTTN